MIQPVSWVPLHLVLPLQALGLLIDPDGAGAMPFVDLADGTFGGVTYAGTGTDNLTISNLSLALDDTDYRIRITTTGSCENFTADANLTVNPVPDAIDAFPGDICADNPLFQQNSSIDLTSYNDDVTGLAGSPDRTIRWYSDALYTSEITGGSLTSYLVVDGMTLYTRVNVISTTCQTDGVFNFTVNPLPAVTAAIDESCEDVLGGLEVAGVDLTTYNATVTGGLANRTVEWYVDNSYLPGALIAPGNGLDDTNYDISVTAYATPTIVYARIYDTSFPTNCFSDTQLSYTINPLPSPNPIKIPDGSTPASATFCKGDALVILQVEPDNPNPNIGAGQTNYTWNVPTGVGEFECVSCGNNFFVILKFTNPVPAGLPITVTETTDPEGCVGSVNTINVIVEDTPSKPTIDDPGIVCENETKTIQIDSPTGGSTYTWAVTSGDASIVGLPVGSSILVNFGVFNSIIEVVETNASGCTAPPADPLNVIMSPRPILDPGLDIDICSDTPTGMVLSSDVVPLADQRFNITNVFVPTGLSANIANVAPDGYVSGAPEVFDFLQNEEFTNVTGGPIAVEYTIEPVNNATNCTGNSVVVRATIYPEASLAANLNATKCSNEASGIQLAVAAGSFAADYYIIEGISHSKVT